MQAAIATHKQPGSIVAKLHNGVIVSRVAAGVLDPGGQREVPIGDAHGDVHLVVPIEQGGLVGAPGDAGGGASVTAALAVALTAKVHRVDEALRRKPGAGRVVEGQVEDGGAGLVERLYLLGVQRPLVDGDLVHVAVEGDGGVVSSYIQSPINIR